MEKTALPVKTHTEYTVGWVCALPKEQTAATAMLDQRHAELRKPPNDFNTYTLGSIGGHNIVIACLPKGKYANNSAASVATHMIDTFPCIKIGLMVGIGGGVPPKVRLGDVVISTPVDSFPGVVQWDLGKENQNGFERTGSLNHPPLVLLAKLGQLETKHEMEGSDIPRYLDEMANRWPNLAKRYLRSDSLEDMLFKAKYNHVVKPKPDDDEDEEEEEEEEEDRCQFCDKSQTVKRKPPTRDMRVHYGLIASGNKVIKNAEFRNQLNKDLGGDVLCIEMEAAGLMSNFPCVVIRGICDYADSHKNKDWQEHAAAVAAAFAKELLNIVTPEDVDVEPRAKELLSEVKQIKQTLENVHGHVKDGFVRTKDTLQIIIDDQERLAVLEWLTSIDYAPQQNDFISRRQPGTGEWLLESTEFRSWFAESKQTIFCPGIPGAGKTIQTSIIVHNLCDRFASDVKVGIAYIYCNFRRQAEQTTEFLLANILKQLAGWQERLPTSVQELYKRHKARYTRPILEELSTTLQSVARAYSRVYVVIDALDECEDKDYNRGKLLTELFSLQTKTGVNLFFTSRFIPEIIEKFVGCLSVEIRPSKEDVWNYLDKHISDLPDFVTNDTSLQTEIKIEIEAAMDGIFLLAQLYLDSLVGKRSIAALRKALRGLRKSSKESLDGSSAVYNAYEKAMERIQLQKGDLPRDAMLTLSWIVNAKRQLKVHELQHALAVEIGQPSLDKDNIPSVNHIIQSCAPLVTIDEESNVIRLVHYTTQEYLERSLIQWFPEAKTEIAKICVTYLSFRVFESGFRNSPENFRKRLRLNRFYNYVAHNWGYHVREAPKSIEEVRSLLASNPKVESASQALNTAETLIISGRNGSQYVPRQVTALHLTAYFGLVEATSTLLEQGHEFDCPDTHGQTPLWWASGNGHVGVVELLLGKGAHLESTDYKSEQSPLSRAARKGHEGVVKLLLDKSADTNTKDKDGKTPLMWAAINGHEGIMNLFLGQNTDLESRDKWGLTPLCWAAISGNDRSVKSLRESGADLNAKDINNTTVLHWAAWEDHKGVVSLLLERNVDIETRNCGGGTALAAAIEKKSAAIVELLLAKGARVNYFYSLYRCNYSPIPRGEEYVVLSGYKWGNPGLFESGKCFYEAGHGDDLDMNNDSTAWFPDRAVTPLWRAAEKWDSATVRLLQSKGGQLDHIEPEISAYVVRRVWSPFPRFDFRTRLCWAANNGYGMIVSLLLENDKAAVELESLSCPVIPLSPPGSHVISSREDHSRWQLSEFNNWSRARQEYQTQFLSLENEREYRLTVTPRKSAMTIPKAEVFAAVALAAQNGHKNVWEILLREKRGVVNWKDFSGQTLLSYAVQYGQKDLVEVLLNFTEDKIDVNSSDNKGRTPLSYAVENKHGADILQLLIFHQADVNLADNEGRSPLLYAAGQGNVQNVRLLFQNGAVQDTIDKSGQTLVLRVIEG